MSEFINRQPKEAPVEEINQETAEISLSAPNKTFSANAKPLKLSQQILNPQNILALQRTIGNQAVQRLIKQTLQRHAGHGDLEELEVQRLMTKEGFQHKTKVKSGKRAGNNPVLLDIDRLLEEFHNTVTPPTIPRKQEILSELSIVKDWLDKKGEKSKRQGALQELWDDIVLEGGSDPQANFISLPTFNLHQTLEPDSLYALINKPQPPGLEAAIKELQNKLNTSLLPNPNLNSGNFDAATEQAVKDFKVANNLPKPTQGTVDDPVWAALDVGGNSNTGLVSYKSTQEQLNQTSQQNVKYTWDVKDDELRITVKINFDDLIPSPVDFSQKVSSLGGKKDGVISNVKAGIDTVWNQFKIVETTSKKARNLVFDVQNVNSLDEDVAKVGLQPGDGRSNGGVWYAGDADLNSKTGPHEFGHIIGLADEYGRGHADYFKLTALNPLHEKSGLTDADADACATRLRNALVAGKDKDTSMTALVEASNILKKYHIYNKPGTGQPVEKKFPEVVVELQRVYKLIGGRQWELSNGKKAGDTMEEATTTFSFRTKSIMGSMENATASHDHGVEPRHVRFFTNFVKTAVPGTYDVEKR